VIAEVVHQAAERTVALVPDYSTQTRVVKDDANVDVVAKERASNGKDAFVHVPGPPIARDLEIREETRFEKADSSHQNTLEIGSAPIASMVAYLD
jgi:hypothetical protein